MKNSRIAKFGRSKEKRSDAKLIVLAVIVNTEGFLKYSDIFEGNTTDCNTLQSVITKLNEKAGYTNRKSIIVMDTGIATEANIQFLKKEGYDYLCVSRSNIKDYQADTNSEPVQIYDKKKQPIELLKVRVENGHRSRFREKGGIARGSYGVHLLPADIAQRKRRTNTLDNLQRDKGNRIHVSGAKNRPGFTPHLP